MRLLKFAQRKESSVKFTITNGGGIVLVVLNTPTLQKVPQSFHLIVGIQFGHIVSTPILQGNPTL